MGVSSLTSAPREPESVAAPTEANAAANPQMRKEVRACGAYSGPHEGK